MPAGSQQRYTACTAIPGIGSNLKLFWHTAPAPRNSSNTLVSMALRASSTGWVGVGFPATAGQMIGSTAMILKACSSCTGGADVRDYFLAAKAVSAVQPPGRLPASNASASAAPDGTLTGSFQVELSAAAVETEEFPLLFAAGSLAPDGSLQQHSTRGSAAVDLQSASGEGGSTHTSSSGGPGGAIRNVRLP